MIVSTELKSSVVNVVWQCVRTKKVVWQMPHLPHCFCRPLIWISMFRVKRWTVRATVEVWNLVVTGCWISSVTMTTRQSVIIYVVTYFTQTIVATEGIVTVMMTSTTSILVTLIDISMQDLLFLYDL